MGNEASSTKNGGKKGKAPKSSVSTKKAKKQVRVDEGAKVAAKVATNSKVEPIVETLEPIVEKKKERRVVTMEPSVRSFSNLSASHTDNPDPVMVTDALADVREKYHVSPKELGHGHYGVVRKCMDRETNQWYAVKSIRKAKISKIEVLKREIEILKEVKHPNIIQLIDVFEDSKYLHLVTEICTGGELFERIIAKTESTLGHFSEHDAANLVRDILDAIAYCHDIKGIAHRDLKPENFLFATEAEDAPIKIIDFGLSRHDDVNHGIMKTKVGTPYYVAPEVLRRQYTKSCDIWSIGVITYILLCGYPPFYGDSDTEIFDSVRTGRFEFPSPEWDTISTEAKDFVTFLIHLDPDSRPTARQAMAHNWITMHADPVDAHVNAEKPSLLKPSNRSATFQKYLALQKLKKAALVVIASKMTQEEVGSLGDIFRRIDQSGDGTMTLTELDDAISLGNFSKEIQSELSVMKEKFALSDSDSLNWKPFLAAAMDKNLVLREDKIKVAFDHFKHADTDYLTLGDFQAIFGQDGQAQEIFDYLDQDKDGHVTFQDFRAAMEESVDLEK